MSDAEDSLVKYVENELKLNGKLNPLIFYQRCKKHFIGLITR